MNGSLCHDLPSLEFSRRPTGTLAARLVVFWSTDKASRFQVSGPKDHWLT